MNVYDEIYKLYADKLYHYCLKLTKNPYEAEDLTQHTFLKAIEKLHTFKNECSVSTWLCTIAKNQFINNLKKTHDFSYEKVLEIYHEKEGNSIEDILISKELTKKIYNTIENLEEPFRDIFILRVFNEMRFKDIGILFNKSEVWARVNYHRAREKIITMLDKKL